MNISRIPLEDFLNFFSVSLTCCPFLLLSHFKVLFLEAAWKERRGEREGVLHEKLT